VPLPEKHRVSARNPVFSEFLGIFSKSEKSNCPLFVRYACFLMGFKRLSIISADAAALCIA
jgi:hypothetical protein